MAAAAALGVVLAGVPLAGTATAADPPVAKIVTGWLPYWTSDDSLATVIDNADLMREVSPFWFQAKKVSGGNGVRVDQWVSDSDIIDVTDQLHAAGVQVVPTITDGTADLFLSNVMRNPTRRAALVRTLTALVIDNNFDGLDLDFEGFAFNGGRERDAWALTRPAWVQFVKELAAALHARDKILTAAVPPEGTRIANYWVYDFEGIGKYLDRLRIMAYDYSYSQPGPIGPYAWDREVLDYATTVVPAGKIQLGVATYGRRWATAASPNCTSSEKSTRTFDAEDVPGLLADLRARAGNGVTIVQGSTWDATAKERTFTYRERSGDCTITWEAWYPDAASVEARAKLVGEYDIAGIAAWTIGGELPGQWSKLRTYARTIAPQPLKVLIATPQPVVAGQPAVIPARSTAPDGTGVRTAAYLQFAPAGSTAYATVQQAATDIGGNIRFSWVPPSNGTLRVRMGAQTGYLAANSRTVPVRVRQNVTLKAMASSGPNRISLIGRVRPADPGALVTIARSTGSSWRTVATARTDAKGVFRVRVNRPAAAATLRATVAPTSGLGAGASPGLAVNGR